MVDITLITNELKHFPSQRMMPAFSTCCDELVDRWKNSAGFDGSFELDVWPEMQNLTGDVISRAAFGSSYQEGRRIFQLQSELAERVIKAVPTIFVPFSWYKFLPLMFWFCLRHNFCNFVISSMIVIKSN
jgi:cytochrome P450